MRASILIILCGFFVPFFSEAQVPFVYTNENFVDSYQDTPATVMLDGWGGFYGTTTTGRVFTQQLLTNDVGIRLQKFSIEEAYYYISDKGPIWAKTDLIALSIYLALA